MMTVGVSPYVLRMVGRVALVTGASRGVGRGIAISLGAAGWTVWITGRSSRVGGSSSPLAGTVEETADDVRAAGGTAHAIVLDHREDDQVRDLVARLDTQCGRLDLLVNNAWGGYERIHAGAWAESRSPFWEQPLLLWDAMMGSGVRTHYVASALCAPLLRRTPRSAIVTVSMEVGSLHHTDHGVAYSVSKAADDRLALAMAGQLEADGVASVSLYPGLVRTEGVMQYAEYLDLDGSQSPEGVGRVVVALAGDPDLLALTGQALHVGELAQRYGVDVG